MWGQIAGAALGAVGGAKGGGKSGGTPKFIRKQIKRGFGNLNTATGRSAEESIAGFNTDQNNAFDMVRGAAGLGAGDVQSAIEMAKRGGAGVAGADIASFFNPYEDAVVGSAVADLTRSRDMTLLGINAQSEAAKAFGGDRDVVAKALASEDYNRRIADTVSGLRFGGYQSAMDAAFRDKSNAISGSGALLDASGVARANTYQDAAALGAVGDTIYARDQSLLDHPLNMAQLQVNAGTSALGAQAPTSSGGGGVSGAIAGALGGMDFGKAIGGLFSRSAPPMSNYGPYRSGYRY